MMLIKTEPTCEKNNQLNSQNLLAPYSLFRLRSCFEAIRERNSGFITQYSHGYPQPQLV